MNQKQELIILKNFTTVAKLLSLLNAITYIRLTYYIRSDVTY